MKYLLPAVVIFLTALKSISQTTASINLSDVASNKNIVTEAWIKEHLRKDGPRAILTNESLTTIKEAVVKDEAIKAYYLFLYKNAESLLNFPLLERKLTGIRLLHVSREAIRRIGTVAIVYAISGEQRFLNRVSNELTAVCNFSDWNPSHFLDVAEMAYGVSIGLDWTLGKLPATTQTLAKKALIEKALKPGLAVPVKSWVSVTNNWNQVCHGGLSVAAVAVADTEPALAAQVISRALEYMPNALKAYAPDGAYPEGASYWNYGTCYTLFTISVFESAFGTDFGISASPGFLQSALFVKMLASPSGLYFNYFDSGSGGKGSMENQELLSWFASRAANGAYFDKKQLKETANKTSTNGEQASKLNGTALTWMVKASGYKTKPLPLNYKGDGVNPIVIFSSAENDAARFFLGAKGGTANLSHGNMDAGSFVFDLDGVRWSVDLGLQDYQQLEEAMGVKNLWDMTQHSQRWGLISKSNFGHSTLTVNDSLHVVNAFAPLTYFNGSEKAPEAEFNLTKVLRDVKSAKRKFKKASPRKLVIEDVLELSDATQSVLWTMMTQADASIVNGGVLLTQNNKMLKVTMKQPANAEVKIVSLDPPPLPHDMKVKGLKRLEFRLPASLLKEKSSKIIVELSGE